VVSGESRREGRSRYRTASRGPARREVRVPGPSGSSAAAHTTCCRPGIHGRRSFPRTCAAAQRLAPAMRTNAYPFQATKGRSLESGVYRRRRHRGGRRIPGPPRPSSLPATRSRGGRECRHADSRRRLRDPGDRGHHARAKRPWPRRSGRGACGTQAAPGARGAGNLIEDKRMRNTSMEDGEFAACPWPGVGGWLRHRRRAGVQRHFRNTGSGWERKGEHHG